MPFLISLLLFAAISAGAASDPAAPGANLLDVAKSNYQAGKFDAALATLDQFDKARSRSADSLDLRGVVLMEENKLAEAAQLFQAAHDANNDLFSPRLHLGEVLFREKKFADARKIYEALLAETNILILTEKLRYAVLLTCLAQHDDGAARAALDAIDFPTETPVYYYAQAAWEFAHGDKGDGQKWISAANQIFDPATVAWCARPLYDFGWLNKKPMLAAP